jgi:hypothetical protein
VSLCSTLFKEPANICVCTRTTSSRLVFAETGMSREGVDASTMPFSIYESQRVLLLCVAICRCDATRWREEEKRGFQYQRAR